MGFRIGVESEVKSKRILKIIYSNKNIASSGTPVKSMLAEDQQKNIFYFFIGENKMSWMLELRN